MTMKAVTYHRYGGPEVLTYGDVPRPTARPGDVLVRVHATSINAADYRMMRADPFLVRLNRGLRAPRQPTLGMDVAGVVVSVGADVERFGVGDAVFGETLDGSGCFAEYATLPERALAKMPDGVSMEHAAAVPLAGVTALQGLRDRGGVAAGEEVLVQGAGGGVGTFIVQIARVLGAGVTAVCGPASVELMRELGADRVIDYTAEDFADSGQRYDVVLGVNGHRSLGDYLRCLRPGGRYVMVGGANAQIFEALLLARLRFLAHDATATVLTVDDRTRADDLAVLADWVSTGTVRPVIDRTYELPDIANAVRYVERGHVRGKVVVRVAQD